MSALSRVFSAERVALIAYVMAGDPDRATTAAILDALARAGADAIELGIPYSDPLADGPTIAAAGMRALEGGTTVRHAFDLVRERSAHAPPVVLFTYYNPVYQYGIDAFARDAAQAGVAGVIVPDLSMEESGDLKAALASAGLDFPMLVAPSTPLQRARAIAEASTGFVYAVSRLGVTGAARAPRMGPLREYLAALRTVTAKPLAVGFGLSSPEHVQALRDLVDAVVVGSALIDSYQGCRGAAAAEKVRDFFTSLQVTGC